MDSITLASPGSIALQLGPLTIRWYGILIGAGFLAGAWAAAKLCKRRALDPDRWVNAALSAFIAGIIGARLYYVALNWETFSRAPQDIIAIWQGGLSIHGGIVGGVIASYIFARVTKYPFLSGIDVAGCALPLAQAIGRWGNFFNSEAFGRPVPENFPLKLFIPPQHRPPQFSADSYFHATFLYESLWDLLIFWLLSQFLFNKLRNYPGMTFLSYLLLYSIGRAMIEPIRVDSIMVGGYAAPSVVSQALVIIAALCMAVLYAYYRSHPVKEVRNESTPDSRMDNPAAESDPQSKP